MTLRRRTMSNQSWNNVMYFNVEIYNIEQHEINVVYFNVDINNTRWLQNNAAIFNVDERPNSFMNMTIFKKLEKKRASKKKMAHLINNTSFWLRSIKKKGKHGTYNVTINVGKGTAWYMKTIWKWQYEFADGKINWCKE